MGSAAKDAKQLSLFRRRVSEQTRDAIKKARGIADRLFGFGETYPDIGADSVIRDRLEVVGLRQEGRKRSINTRIIFRKPSKFASHAAMSFGNLARAGEDESLRGMVDRQICGASRCLGKFDACDGAGFL